ncbi:MAG: lactonase family protein [Variovorax sp.]
MTTAVYVSNADSGDISVLALDGRSGALSALQTVAIGGRVMPMALSPDRRMLYAARRTDPLAVVALSIDRESGRLALEGEAPLPHSMAYLAVDHSGRWLFSASYGGNMVAVSPIAACGMPHAARQVIATGPNAHCIVAGPGNAHVYATSLGSDLLMHFRFDSTTGALASAEPPALQLPAGSGPRHLVFDRRSRFAYLLGELDGSITLLRIDAGSGAPSPLQTVSVLPPGFAGKPWAADLHLTPDGRFLYASERRSNTLAMFVVDAHSGMLSPIGHVPAPAQPRGFAIDPQGRFLLAAGEMSDGVGVYSIDADGGKLTHCADMPVGRGPNWIETVALDE